ncbi:MAG: hypothetical protein H7Y60_16790 [Rhodospirillaceae bacterium]|nr:hypothetical protein [Rhodospirillales bacterium]
MMKSLLAAVALVIAVLGLAQPAQADPRRHDGWSDGWRDDWRWDRPHRYARPPREVIMVYPSPPVVYAQPSPRVVFMDPPVQAIPTSPPYTDGYGRYCREYQSMMTVGGSAQRGYGTACLQPDGSWRIVN